MSKTLVKNLLPFIIYMYILFVFIYIHIYICQYALRNQGQLHESFLAWGLLTL